MDKKPALPTSPRDKPRPNPVSTIADVLKNIMSEIASSPDMRAILRAQVLIDLMAEMQSKVEPPLVNQAGSANPPRQTEVVQKLETRFTALEARTAALDAYIKSGLHVVDFNSAARAYNGAITSTHSHFRQLLNEQNQNVHGFPATGDDLNKMSAHQLNNLLKVFGLASSKDASGSEQRKRFLEYIGAAFLARGGQWI